MQTKTTRLLVLLGLAAGCAPAAPLDDARAWADAEENQWEGCPAPVRAPVGDGELWLQAAIGNVTCAAPDLGVELVEEELARKAQLHLVAGDYFLPTADGEHEIDLPLCARLEDGVIASAAGEKGTLLVSRTEVLGRERLRLTYERPVFSAQGGRYTFHLDLEGDASDLSAGVLIDGRPWTASGATYRSYLCRGAACELSPEEGEESEERDDLRIFQSCERDDLPEEVHRFELEGGSMSVRVRTNNTWDDFQGVPVRAAGELGGTPFVVEGYWDLVMRQAWWYDTARDFVARFREPIGETCGLVVRAAYPYPDANWSTQAFTLGCDGARGEEREVLSADWERLTPLEE